MEQFLPKIEADSDERLEERRQCIQARLNWFENQKGPRWGEDGYEEYQNDWLLTRHKLGCIEDEQKCRRNDAKLRAALANIATK